MKRTALAVAAVLAVAPLMAGTPAFAVTAFQNWAAGRGVFVPSKERLSTFQDDLAIYGVAPPPDESPRYRWRRLEERYGVERQPGPDYRY